MLKKIVYDQSRCQDACSCGYTLIAKETTTFAYLVYLKLLWFSWLNMDKFVCEKDDIVLSYLNFSSHIRKKSGYTLKWLTYP